jgi:hypothetical protein
MSDFVSCLGNDNQQNGNQRTFSVYNSIMHCNSKIAMSDFASCLGDDNQQNGNQNTELIIPGFCLGTSFYFITMKFDTCLVVIYLRHQQSLVRTLIGSTRLAMSLGYTIHVIGIPDFANDPDGGDQQNRSQDARFFQSTTQLSVEASNTTWIREMEPWMAEQGCSVLLVDHTTAYRSFQHDMMSEMEPWMDEQGCSVLPVDYTTICRSFQHDMMSEMEPWMDEQGCSVLPVDYTTVCLSFQHDMMSEMEPWMRIMREMEPWMDEQGCSVCSCSADYVFSRQCCKTLWMREMKPWMDEAFINCLVQMRLSRRCGWENGTVDGRTRVPHLFS